jgi:P-type Cu+ transporter
LTVSQNNILEKTFCFHCGDVCPDNSVALENKTFCCVGCKTVYEILDAGKLCNYYSISSNPGLSPPDTRHNKFDYLDEDEVSSRLIEFRNEEIISVTFYIPQMHCSSCIWLLENLYKLNPGISVSTVDFLKKELNIRFFHKQISLKEVVSLISAIGYEPLITLQNAEKSKMPASNKKLYYKIGVAAFSFGNIMLLSFPEYLSSGLKEEYYIRIFTYASLFLSFPVFFYCASDYMLSAYNGLKNKIVNIDFPLSVGIIVLFARSTFEIFTLTGPGYLDSLSGLLFFLLLGKLFQSKTYDSIRFDRDYKSYFPLSVTIKKDLLETNTSISNLQVGDRIIIRNNEILPADSVLFSGNARIDNSFITGEFKLIDKNAGDLVYAGAKLSGAAAEFEVIKKTSQSYLTGLWNNEIFNKTPDRNFTTFSNTISKYFTLIILVISTILFLFWLPYGLGKSLNVLTSVLIVACPCALAMSAPFTLGNTLRIFGRSRFYVKNNQSVERLAGITHIVFDKTGTITQSGNSEITFIGENLNDELSSFVRSLTANSSHPLSRKIYSSLPPAVSCDVKNYREIPNAGLEGIINGIKVKLGSKEFVAGVYKDTSAAPALSTEVYLSVEDKIIGYFRIQSSYRKSLGTVINDLSKNYKISLLTGDNESEKGNLLKFFGSNSEMLFRQSPEAKMEYVKNLQNRGEKVLMIGDGLNDAGAIAQADVGISVTDDIGSFSPASDAILDSADFSRLYYFIRFAGAAKKLVYFSFGISFFYNIIGLAFAARGLLSPIIAAVLMPLSSVSVVLFASLSTNMLARKRRL